MLAGDETGPDSCRGHARHVVRCSFSSTVSEPHGIQQTRWPTDLCFTLQGRLIHVFWALQLLQPRVECVQPARKQMEEHEPSGVHVRGLRRVALSTPRPPAPTFSWLFDVKRRQKES